MNEYVLNALALYYLTHNTGVIGELEPVNFEVGDTLSQVISKMNKTNIVSLGDCMLSSYWWRKEELGFTAELFTEAERFLKTLRDTLLPNNRQFIAIKMETGGLHTWVHEKRCRGSEYYPVLQLTLKANSHPARTWYIDPGSTANRIKSGVKRILANRHDVLVKAVNEGQDIKVVHNEIKDYLTQCHIKPNDPNKQHITQLVCMNDVFVRAFVNDQLQVLNDYISPKYIDIVAYNNVVDAAKHQECVVYPQYTDTPEEYVDALLNLIIPDN